MAFHLGCFRALQDRGILEKVKVISTVSGGSVIGACYAYWPTSFPQFDQKMTLLLKEGIQKHIAREVFLSSQFFRILATLCCKGVPSVLAAFVIFGLSIARRYLGVPTAALETLLADLCNRIPVWSSFTTAFESALRKNVLGSLRMTDIAKPDLEVVINTCELRTGTAFRFGSRRSGGWRFGVVKGQSPFVAKAVVASAAFPILLPPLMETFEFVRKGRTVSDTVTLTDGGVFENLGVAVLEPGRSNDITVTYHATHIISLNAGAGQLDSREQFFWWGGRVARAFGAVHRKAQDALYQRLHKFVETGELRGFGMVYLGQQDDRLPSRPADLVRREQVYNYPTDFAPISELNLKLLTKRGEQLTHIIIDRYLPELGA